MQTVTVADNPPFTNIEIPVVVDSTITRIHVFDVSGVDTSVGMVTIRGLVNLQMFPNPQIRVAVAVRSLTDTGGPGFDTAFNNIRNVIDPGLRHLGGLQFFPPATNPTDTTFLDNSMVSVNIRGDLTGNVTAGMLYRIDALRADTDPNPQLHFGGTISGNLRSTRGDGRVIGLDGYFNPSIGYVRGQWQITGNITADGERDANGVPLFDVGMLSTWGSAGRIVVGPNPNAPGIRGDINCENGRIDDIFCTGQIGTGPQAGQRSIITAGVRIGRITVRPEGTTDDADVLPRAVYADVQASARGVAAPTLLGFHERSSVTLIETEGDFTGAIDLLDLYGGTGIPTQARQTGRAGIFVGGAFTGDIDVTYNYEYGDMIARSFRGDITIGQMLKGAIVAVGIQGSTDPLDGTIGSVTVGFNPDLTNSPRANGQGFNAVNRDIIAPPFEGAARGAWYSAAPPNGFEFDSVIRADKSIGSLALKSMSNRLSAIGGKFARARIESPLIGTLAIEHFDAGSVWSGKLNSPTSICGERHHGRLRGHRRSHDRLHGAEGGPVGEGHGDRRHHRRRVRRDSHAAARGEPEAADRRKVRRHQPGVERSRRVLCGVGGLHLGDYCAAKRP